MQQDNHQESIVIDPVAMNIVNRVAPGTRMTGGIESDGGLIVEGTFIGSVKVTGGPLVLMQGGVIQGDIFCSEDAYLFGTITGPTDDVHAEIEVAGAAFLAETLTAKANLTAADFKVYEGTQFDGRIRTVRKPQHAQSKVDTSSSA